MRDNDSTTRPVKRAVVLYATMFGTTEVVAEQVAEELSARFGEDVQARDITWFDPAELASYDLIVIGASTWNVGQLPSDLTVKLPQLATLDLAGRHLALFGTGDQLGYPDSFLDAVGIVAEELAGTGAKLIGAVPAGDYDFTLSLALRGERLVGLGVDEDNQPELTAERVTAWVDQLVNELNDAVPETAARPVHAAA